MNRAMKILGTASLLATLTAFGAVAQTTATDKTATPPATATPATPKADKAMTHALMSRQRVEQIQTALKNKGEKVEPDGVWGPQTAAALRDFQKQNGLKVTGHADRATIQKLDIPNRST